MRIKTLFLSVSFSFFLTSCGSNDESNTPAGNVEPKLSSIQKEIFDVSCNAPSCHGSGVKGGLSLIAGNSYQQLVGISSTTDMKNIPPFVRVKAGSPNSSFLCIKLTAPENNQGEAMPKGGDKLQQNKIDAIRQWIAAGAKND